jgi:folate-binding Fe-S cluster repair protein YgfZ
MPVEGAGPLTSGAPVTVGEVEIGRIGSVAGRRGLALVRLDRAAEAAAEGQALSAAGVAIVLRRPGWATFELTPESFTKAATGPAAGKA